MLDEKKLKLGKIHIDLNMSYMMTKYDDKNQYQPRRFKNVAYVTVLWCPIALITYKTGLISIFDPPNIEIVQF